MHLERYEYDQLDEFTYRFFSTGPNGRFEMRIRFVEMGYSSYNLGFGVVHPETDRLDDLMIVSNGDSQKILATVANVTLIFLEDHPQAAVYATGSTKSRTRLYQMGINRSLPMLGGYTIRGYLTERDRDQHKDDSYRNRQGKWHSFQPGSCYEAFLIYKS